MGTSAIILMILFMAVIWGGLAFSIVLLVRTDDEVSGELGNAPGTDDESLLQRTVAAAG